MSVLLNMVDQGVFKSFFIFKKVYMSLVLSFFTSLKNYDALLTGLEALVNEALLLAMSDDAGTTLNQVHTSIVYTCCYYTCLLDMGRFSSNCNVYF